MERWKSSITSGLRCCCTALRSMVSAMQWICVLWFEVLLMGNYGWPHLLAMGVNCWAIALADAIRPHAL